MRPALAALAAAGLWPQLHAPHTEGAPSEGAQNGGAWAGPKLNKGAIEQRADTFKHANSVMSSPDVRIVVADGGSSQMAHVPEGGSFQYTVSLSHPPSTTRGEDVIDFSQDTVQIWLTSSQAVMVANGGSNGDADTLADMAANGYALRCTHGGADNKAPHYYY